MSNLDFTLKRKNGSVHDVLLPTTHMGQIYTDTTLATTLSDHLTATYIPLTQKGQNNGVAPLGANGKISSTYFDADILGGLKYGGTLSAATDLTVLLDGLDPDVNQAGYYWIVTAETVTLSSGSEVQTMNAPGDDGDYTLPITLEQGDWLLLDAVTGESIGTWSIIDFNYHDATISNKGVVVLSNTDTLEGLSTGDNAVITEGILADLRGTGGGQLAAGNHNHDNTYLGISASAVSASKWATPRTLTLSGDVSGTSSSWDGSGNATLVVTVADDSHNHVISNVDGLQDALDGKVDENSAITAGTHTKITYDAKGLVTSGADLVSTDIPALDASKITTGTFNIARIPTGTTSTTVSLGNHTHTFASLTSKPTTIAGYGITDAYTQTEVENLLVNFVGVYYNTAAANTGDLVIDLDSDGSI